MSGALAALSSGRQLLGTALTGGPLQHIYFIYEFGAYSPGVATAALLTIPGVLYLAWAALQRRLLAWWYVALIFLPTIPQVRLVVETGNVVPPQMRFGRLDSRCTSVGPDGAYLYLTLFRFLTVLPLHLGHVVDISAVRGKLRQRTVSL